MYVIGNMGCLTGGSSTWRKIFKKLKGSQAIGKGLELYCEYHGKITVVEKASDFERVKGGGCGDVCGGVLDCGHACYLSCHKGVEVHGRVRCVEVSRFSL